MPTTTKSGRQTRRREETRRKLLEAASALFARQGVDITRINEITEAADVGFGSFYNHFDDKDAIVAAVLAEQTSAIGAAIDRATADLADPAEVVAVAHRTVLARVMADREFGWLLVRLEISHGLATAALGPYAMRDIRRGIAEGRFKVDDPALTGAAAGGALLGVIKASLDGHLDADAPARHAAGVLRLLGLPAKQAASVASRPMPTELE